MKEKLEEYINGIHFKVKYDYNRCEDVYEWIFEGDGEGDFEKQARGVKDKLLLDDYIAYCKNQVYFAERYKKEYFGG